ncbi:MAG: hypothetical protein HY711_08505, partial [Candidatus Melainabacteria bacterium]|nr:hypothetical protein [Candidatus Melainabacteria bacterium]
MSDKHNEHLEDKAEESSQKFKDATEPRATPADSDVEQFSHGTKSYYTNRRVGLRDRDTAELLPPRPDIVDERKSLQESSAPSHSSSVAEMLRETLEQLLETFRLLSQRLTSRSVQRPVDSTLHHTTKTSDERSAFMTRLAESSRTKDRTTSDILPWETQHYRAHISHLQDSAKENALQEKELSRHGRSEWLQAQSAWRQSQTANTPETKLPGLEAAERHAKSAIHDYQEANKHLSARLEALKQTSDLAHINLDGGKIRRINKTVRLVERKQHIVNDRLDELEEFVDQLANEQTAIMLEQATRTLSQKSEPLSPINDRPQEVPVKAKPEETKPKPEETKPKPEETKPKPEETKPK